ncbi:uncharacterized protein N7469_004490 [Penicillium citrinum]|uniref:Uncharacterized protein n=2 Tax=Penicillium TaxID=5073 RepID=A0A9W9P4R6_PENCI|nr:uncharacterized protein N7469_004490 [Penicillium citrinum]KAJ5235322.1 hypothetical protein N7469_004490 [Penicillium citrinum]KAJ5590950.1 hypothetical protein N7450_004922 [Penicillium hetheringtonii]
MSKSNELDATDKGSPDMVTPNGNSPSSKRKRNSEPGYKSKKNKKQDGGDRVNGNFSDLDEPSMKPNGSRIDGDGKRIRGPRIGAKSGKKIGFFEEEETRAMEDHKVNFCNLNGISASEFDAMVQHSDRGDGEFPCPGDVCTKAEFWSSIYNLLPNRERRSVYRFMRRHFQTSDQKPHEWTEKQDKELIDLITQYGPKYTLIAKMLGRTDDDVTQRWKNRLEHRSTMQYGPWMEQELRDLVNHVSLVAQSHQESGYSGDVYEMDEKLVPWGKISDLMNNTRSRQQCADKWRKIRKTVLEERAYSNPNAVFDPSRTAKKHSRRSETPRVIKSKKYVDDYDSDNEGRDEQVDQSTLSVPESFTTAKDPSPEPQVESESHLDLEPSSHQEDAGSSGAGTPSSPVHQRSNSMNEEKRRKKLQKAKEERELAEARGLTAAEAKEERKRMRKEQKEEKKRRKSLKLTEPV